MAAASSAATPLLAPPQKSPAVAGGPVRAKPPTWDEIRGARPGAYHMYSSALGSGAGESKEQYWTEDRTVEVPIRYSASGFASEAVTPATTIPALFQLACRRQGPRAAIAIEEGVEMRNEGGKSVIPPAVPLESWKTWSYNQYYDECKAAAAAFIALGLKRFDGVSIHGFNAPAWLMAELAAILAGGCAAGIYPTDTEEQVKYKALHSGAVVACVENDSKLEMMRRLAPSLPKLRAIVIWSPTEDTNLKDEGAVKVMTWDQLIKSAAEGGSEGMAAVDARIAEQRPGHCCAYIYTSGTTGMPKAVMITHDNIIYEANNAVNQIAGFGDGPGNERVISYLPLSHVAGMMVDIVCPLVTSAFRENNTTVYFARAYDLKAGSIGDRLRGVRPTMFLGVPRVWEKIMEKMQATVAANPPTGVKLKIARWALRKSLAHQMASQMGGDGSKGCCFGFANKKVLSVVKQRLGLDACKYALTGAAPIKVETLTFFGERGIQINEVYGMSECTGACTWSTDDAHKWGYCGWALPGVEVRILDEEGNVCPMWNGKGRPTEKEQGEVCYRGRNIMAGYMANPDMGAEHVEEIREKNRKAIDANGWLHSGDKGVMDTDGMVKITGRYKELIIGAGGENIAPVPIEDMIKAECPAISNIMMVGDKRKFNVALVTLKTVGATGELPGTNDLDGPAATMWEGVTTLTEAMDSDAVTATITNVITKVNGNTTVVPSNAAKIQKFTILPTDFSVTGEELTPTLKLKRGFVDEKYKTAIDAMYAGGKAAYVKYSA